MKKFLTSLALATLCSFAVNAQDSAPQNSGSTAPRTTQEIIQKRDTNSAKWQNASAEEKQRMAERRQKMENMSPEERAKMKAEHEQKKEKRQEKYNNASPEEKARMEKRHAVMEKLSPEQKKAVHAERERHRAAMKQIIGVDLMPAHPAGE